jgi:tetratricopeptide (TPR) repeat protein
MKRTVGSLLSLVLLLALATPAFCDVADDLVDSGLAKKAKGDLDGAIADYTKAIAIKADDAAAYNNRGSAKQAKGDLGEAKENSRADF